MKMKIFVLLSWSYFLCFAQPEYWHSILDANSYNKIINDSRGDLYASFLDYNTYLAYVIKSNNRGESWDTVLVYTGSITWPPDIFVDTMQSNDRIIVSSNINYLSTNYGESWEPMNFSALRYFSFTSTGDLLAFRYADYNLYRSTDNGSTWVPLTSLPTPSYNDYRLNDLAVDIYDNIYIIIHYGGNAFPPNTWDEIYKSTDNGSSWDFFYISGGGYQGDTQIYTTRVGDLFIRDPNNYYSLRYLKGGGIKTYDDLFIYSPWQINSNQIYILNWGIVGSPKVLFSLNGGDTWEDISYGIPGYMPRSYLCNDSLGYLYLNSGGGNSIYKTAFTTRQIFEGAEIDFGDVRLYDTLSVSTTLNNSFDFDILIDSMIIYDDHFFVSELQNSVIPAQDSISVSIGYCPAAFDTNETYLCMYSELLNARTKLKGYSPYPIMGTIPSVLLFHKVVIDSSVYLSVRIPSNNSLNDLVIDTIFIKNGTAYSLENIPFPIVLGSTDTAEFFVLFQPTEPIIYWDTVVIHSNAEIAVKSFRLLGEGMIPNSAGTENNDIFVFQLNQNYPNPFNPTTRIKYQIPELSRVKLTVYNVLGKVVTNLLNEIKSAGTYEVEFDGTDLPSGVYFYRIEAGKYSGTKKFVLLK